MKHDVGKKIKELRLQKGMTQDVLAAALNLSAQSVSKWENGVTLPDIQLLPDLSALFGVSIDELFSLTDETRFARIDSMLAMQKDPSAEDCGAAEDFLTHKLHDEKHKGRALTQLAHLHAIERYIRDGGLSRGSYLVAVGGGTEGDVAIDTANSSRALVTRMDCNCAVECGWEDVRPIPIEDNWFENVWRDYREGAVFV